MKKCWGQSLGKNLVSNSSRGGLTTDEGNMTHAAILGVV